MLVTEEKILAYSWKSNLWQICISAVYKVISFFFFFSISIQFATLKSYIFICRFAVGTSIVWHLRCYGLWAQKDVENWSGCVNSLLGFALYNSQGNVKEIVLLVAVMRGTLPPTHIDRYERTQRLSTCTMPARIVARIFYCLLTYMPSRWPCMSIAYRFRNC